MQLFLYLTSYIESLNNFVLTHCQTKLGNYIILKIQQSDINNEEKVVFLSDEIFFV